MCRRTISRDMLDTIILTRLDRFSVITPSSRLLRVQCLLSSPTRRSILTRLTGVLVEMRRGKVVCRLVPILIALKVLL